MRILVLGAAVSGLAAARLAVRLGWSVSVYDQSNEPTLALLDAGVAPVSGQWSRDLLDGVDLVVTSPGIPERSAAITDVLESGIPLWSEIEFAARHIDAPVVAITGTNGKTTVTALVAEMLSESGRRAAPLGNIGTPLSDAVGRNLDVAVVEVSSFQLRFTEDFRPDVAVVTNVAPDHLDWHGSFERYLDAKRQIVARQRPDDVVIYDADDEGALRLVTGAASTPIPISGRRIVGPYGSDGIDLVISGAKLAVAELPIAEMAVDSPAFLFDLAAAGAAAIEAGASVDDVLSVVGRFQPARHRRTLVGEVGGVRFVDDSKATNPHAAMASIDGFDSVVLIAGGLSKGLDIAPLATHPHVRFVVAIGEAAPVLLEAAGDRGMVATSMEEAVALAADHARSGDTVLLAPGCASFDMFDDYGHRGDVFTAAVAGLTRNSVL